MTKPDKPFNKFNTFEWKDLDTKEGQIMVGVDPAVKGGDRTVVLFYDKEGFSYLIYEGKDK